MSETALPVSGVLSRVNGRVLNCAGATLVDAIHVERGRVYTIHGRWISSFSQGGFSILSVLASGKTTLNVGFAGLPLLRKNGFRRVRVDHGRHFDSLSNGLSQN